MSLAPVPKSLWNWFTLGIFNTSEPTFQLTLESETYDFTADVKGNLIIKGGHVNIRGNGHKVHGWMHVEVTGGRIANLIVEPQRLIKIDGECEVCGRKSKLRESTCCVSHCSGNDVTYDDVTIHSPLPLKWFACGNETTTVTNGVFNGVKFNDPPASGYVLRV